MRPRSECLAPSIRHTHNHDTRHMRDAMMARTGAVLAGLLGAASAYNQPNIVFFLAGNAPCPTPLSLHLRCVLCNFALSIILACRCVPAERVYIARLTGSYTLPSRPPSDDIGWSDFGYFGMDLYGATPMIDTLAEQGVRLACVYGQTACTPGRAAFLTGKHKTSRRW